MFPIERPFNHPLQPSIRCILARLPRLPNLIVAVVASAGHRRWSPRRSREPRPRARRTPPSPARDVSRTLSRTASSSSPHVSHPPPPRLSHRLARAPTSSPTNSIRGRSPTTVALDSSIRTIGFDCGHGRSSSSIEGSSTRDALMNTRAFVHAVRERASARAHRARHHRAIIGRTRSASEKQSNRIARRLESLSSHLYGRTNRTPCSAERPRPRAWSPAPARSRTSPRVDPIATPSRVSTRGESLG